MNYLLMVIMLLYQILGIMPMNYGIQVLTIVERILLGEVERKQQPVLMRRNIH